jgi:DNA-binding SARP family transcriptional activator/tetratricopeptide (TPR) repeat protein
VESPVALAVLGPVSLSVGGERVPLSKLERGLLACLAVADDTRASSPMLQGWLWDDNPPSSPRNRVQALVSGLRRKVGAGLIITEGAGYRLADGVDVDHSRWQALVSAARRGDDEMRRDRLHLALALFTGAPLDGIPAARDSDTEIIRLEEERVRVLEERIEADLDGGQIEGLCAELAKLTSEHPLREDLLAQQVRCLAATGRQADALAAYRAAFQRLRDELGIEPGAALRAAHDSVLAGQVTAEPAGPPRAGATALTTLPRGPATYVGRDGELEQITRAAAEAVQRPAVVGIWGLSGTGKSALAIEAGHRLRDTFTGGCLYLDLAGETGRAGSDAVVALFLRLLDVPADAVPDDHDQRVALYRSVGYGRRVLVILDGVTTGFDVDALLPSGPGSMAMLIGRTPVPDLALARSIRLGPLTQGAALDLLGAFTGRDRIESEPAAALELVRLCAASPLALRLVGSRLADRPDLTLERMVLRLADDESRSAEGTADDGELVAGVADAYAGLQPSDQAMLRAVAQLPIAEISAWMCSALAGSDRSGELTLDRLIDAGLVDPRLRADVDAQYRLHDLARRYAGRQPAESDDLPAPAQVVAVRMLAELRRHHPRYPLQLVPAPPLPHGPSPVAELGTAAAALRFFRSEHERVFTIARAVAAHRPELAWRLLATAANHAAVNVDVVLWQSAAAEVRGLLPADGADAELGRAYLELAEAALCYEAGRAAAAGSLADTARHRLVRAGDTPAAVAAAVLAGRAARVQGDRPRAEAELSFAAAHSEECGPALQGWVELGWAILHNDYDELQPAARACERSLAHFLESEDLIGRATASYSLARALTRLGVPDRALELCNVAIDMFADLADHHSRTVALDARAETHLELGNLTEALADARAAVTLAVSLHNRYATAHARRTYGRALAAAGRTDVARRELAGSAEQFEALGRPLSVAASRRELAAVDDPHQGRSDLAAG